MKIKLKNLGIVRLAEIDLSKNLTIFCGPNGTGKTYVAYILNALCNKWSNYFSRNALSEIDNLQPAGKTAIENQHLHDWTSNIVSALKQDLPSIFGISRSESNRIFKNAELSISYDADDLERIRQTPVKSTIYLGSKKIAAFEKKKGAMEFSYETFAEETDSRTATAINSSVILALIFKQALLCKHSSRMLTVERNSIYTFKTELTSNRFEAVNQVLISEDGDAETIVKSRANLYPLAVRNSLAVAMDLENIIKQESPYIYFARNIEKELLDGTVTVGKEGDVQFNAPAQDEAESVLLPIRMSSSAVKTLSGLVIYLKHLAQKGDILIVDEPEMNLHPDNQRRLARIFARMVNKGIRLIISTHSDYFIREFNNMVMAASLPAEQSDMISAAGYTSDDLLDKSRMQAYLFNYDGNGQVDASPIRIDEFGFEVTTIDHTIESQNEATLLLHDTLEA